MEEANKKIVTTWLTKLRANLRNSQSATDTWPDYSRFRRLTPYLEKGGQWKKEKLLEIPRKKWLPKYRVNPFYIFEFSLFSLFTSIFFVRRFPLESSSLHLLYENKLEEGVYFINTGTTHKEKVAVSEESFWQTRMRVTITQQKLRSVRLLLPQESLSAFISDICVVSVWFITVIFWKDTHTP